MRGRGKGRHLIPNPVLPMVGRSLTNRKCDVFIVMKWAIMLQIVHKRNPGRDPRRVLMVRDWPRSLSWVSLFLHAWFHPLWDVCGTWTMELHSTCHVIRIFSVPWRRRISRCGLGWAVMEGTMF